MHLFGLSMFFVATLAVGVQCTWMVVVLTEEGRYGEIKRYALIEPTLFTAPANCTCVMKSTQTVDDGYPGLITQDFTGWEYDTGKLCDIRFYDQNPEQNKSFIGGYFLSISGRIGHLSNVANRLAGTPFITFVFNNPISITQDSIDPTRMQFFGFQDLSPVIVLPLTTRREEELLESFRETISASVEFTTGTIKKPTLLQSSPYQSILFNGASFQFFNFWEVTQTNLTQKNYEIIKNQKPCILTESSCCLKISTPNGTKYAIGMFNLLNDTGTIWIQSVWDGEKKLDMNTTEMFDKLKNIKGCSITDAIAQTETSDTLGSFPPSKWVTVSNYYAKFDPFTKKFNFKFEFGAEEILYFLDGEEVRHVQAYRHSKIDLLTLFGEDLEKFEYVRSRANPQESFKMMPVASGVSKMSKDYINRYGVRIISKIQDNLGPDTILKRSFCQYTF